MTKSQKDEAKFLDTRIGDETASTLEKWNLAILAVALLHDAEIISESDIRRVLSDGGYPACEKGAAGTNPILNALKGPFKRKPKP